MLGLSSLLGRPRREPLSARIAGTNDDVNRAPELTASNTNSRVKLGGSKGPSTRPHGQPFLKGGPLPLEHNRLGLRVKLPDAKVMGTGNVVHNYSDLERVERIGSNNRFGHGVQLEARSVVGNGNVFGSGVLAKGRLIVGNNCRIQNRVRFEGTAALAHNVTLESFCIVEDGVTLPKGFESEPGYRISSGPNGAIVKQEMTRDELVQEFGRDQVHLIDAALFRRDPEAHRQASLSRARAQFPRGR